MFDYMRSMERSVKSLCFIVFRLACDVRGVTTYSAFNLIIGLMKGVISPVYQTLQNSINLIHTCHPAKLLFSFVFFGFGFCDLIPKFPVTLGDSPVYWKVRGWFLEIKSSKKVVKSCS